MRRMESNQGPRVFVYLCSGTAALPPLWTFMVLQRSLSPSPPRCTTRGTAFGVGCVTTVTQSHAVLDVCVCVCVPVRASGGTPQRELASESWQTAGPLDKAGSDGWPLRG
jgi:hypothetical protein